MVAKVVVTVRSPVKIPPKMNDPATKKQFQERKGVREHGKENFSNDVTH